MLDFYCRPSSYVKNFMALNISEMAKNGIKLLLCDIDNTLVAWDEAYPSESAFAFFKECELHHIKVILCSNNTEERVSIFAKAANLEYYSFFCKPFKINYWKILKKEHLKRKEIAVAGDQILTDIVGGNRMHFHTIFFDPLVKVDSKHTGFSRYLEKYVLRWLIWRKRFNKGEYYGYKM